MKSPLMLVSVLTIGVLSGNLVAADPAVPNPLPSPSGKSEVGISAHDGITISGTDVLMTRNGRTEKLMQELTLPNGMRVKLNRTVVMPDGKVVPLRATQVLTMDGSFVEIPATVPVPPVRQPVVIMPAPPVPPATPIPATPKQHIKAGEGVQK